MFTEQEVEVGRAPEAKTYKVFLADGEPIRVEAVFYGYRGRTTYRPVKENGAAWRSAVAACKVKEK